MDLNTAATAILVPILMGMVGRRGEPRGATGSLLAVAYACSAGGLGTLVGSPPNLITVRLLEEGGASIGFLGWMVVGLPTAALVCLAIYLTARLMFPPASVAEPPERGTEGGSYREPPPPVAAFDDVPPAWRRGEIATAVSFGLAVLGWTLPGILQATGLALPDALDRLLDPGIVALLAASILFAVPDGTGPRVLAWRDATRIDWGIILLFGGGIALGTQLDADGARRRHERGLRRAHRHPRALGLHRALLPLHDLLHRDLLEHGDRQHAGAARRRRRRGARRLAHPARPRGGPRRELRLHAADRHRPERHRLQHGPRVAAADDPRRAGPQPRLGRDRLRRPARALPALRLGVSPPIIGRADVVECRLAEHHGLVRVHAPHGARPARASGVYQTSPGLLRRRLVGPWGEGIAQYIALRVGDPSRGRAAYQSLLRMLGALPPEELLEAPGPKARLYRLARSVAETERAMPGDLARSRRMPWRAVAGGRGAAIDRLRAELRASEAELLELRHARELSVVEIACVLEEPADEIELWLDTAEARARHILGEHAPDPLAPRATIFVEAFALEPGWNDEDADEVPVIDAAPLEAGTVIGGRYAIVERVGVGAFGDVYRADDTEVPGHRVALKLLRQPSLSESARQAALRELRMNAAVFHPSLVQFRDHGWYEQRLWFVMPWYEGETLEQRMRRAPLTRAEARRIFEPLARALAALHAAAIRHQDIKPDNVLLTKLPGSREDDLLPRAHRPRRRGRRAGGPARRHAALLRARGGRALRRRGRPRGGGLERRRRLRARALAPQRARAELAGGRARGRHRRVHRAARRGDAASSGRA
ncbi:MAG: SLC13 family permease [Sandaracinaceae bacterium]|nr:SLC13 family permease [Sandaracinaceae bacterium]